MRAVAIDVQYPADFSDNRILVGASHNVFIGRVLGQVGTKSRGLGPETQFEVQVIMNIKGNLSGNVVVDQAGGISNGTLYYIEDGGALLKAGVTYILATRYNRNDGWYTLNPYRSGSQFIINDPKLSVSQLQDLASKDLRVKDLQEAYPDEVLLQADINEGNALNNYQSIFGKNNE